MFKFLIIALIVSFTRFAYSQPNPADNLDFSSVLQTVLGQWASQITPENVASLLSNFQQTGNLNHIWHSLGDHCSSNVECGPDACCLKVCSKISLKNSKPTIQGKRAITDGNQIHYGSYCANLRKAGETCSKFDTNQHYYNFHCPCLAGLTCKGNVIQIHPLLSVTTEAICK